jgi:GntR family transcriptional repressor for pyruvate dehydrogenase complex
VQSGTGKQGDGRAGSGGRARLRQPRLADLVADRLRERILSDELGDGALLPKQEELLEEFGVSLPPIREALRILETEGLLTVRRGNTGGAVVRAPQARKVAYMIGLVLQAGQVGVEDVAVALRSLEPVCAALAAGRPDRHSSVVATLTARLARSRRVLDDADEYVHQARVFHEELVAGCGNETMILLVGALESLWSAHVDTLARQPAQLGAFEARAARVRSVEEHAALLGAVDAGDAALAETLAREHFGAPERHEFVAAGTTVRGTLLRDG